MSNYTDPYFGFEYENTFKTGDERGLDYITHGLKTKLKKKVFLEPKSIGVIRGTEGAEFTFELEVGDLMEIWQLMMIEESIIFSLKVPTERLINRFP